MRICRRVGCLFLKKLKNTNYNELINILVSKKGSLVKKKYYKEFKNFMARSSNG